MGIEVSASFNANKAHLATPLEDSVVGGPFPSVSMSHFFQVNHNIDITALGAADITPATHFYLKVGGSYAQFTHQLLASPGVGFNRPIVTLNQTSRRDVWGIVGGVGLRYDVAKWANVFIEFDQYHYSLTRLNTINGLVPGLAAGQVDSLTQHVSISPFSVRVGINVMWLFHKVAQVDRSRAWK